MTPSMSLFNFITQECDNLAATTAPSVSVLGLHIVLALATIMMVWFGVQEALASARGGTGFDIRKFFSFFILITFAYAFVKYYDAAIPGIGFSITGFIKQGTENLVGVVGINGADRMIKELGDAQKMGGPGIAAALLHPYFAFVYGVIQVLLAACCAIISMIVAYGAIGITIMGLLGPVFIPFLVIEKLSWLFWGWLKAYLGFAFYKVVAAATLNVLSHVLAQYYIQLVHISDPAEMVKALPLLILLVMVTGYILIKIPAMTASLFSGHVGGHDAGLGFASLALLRR